MRDDHQQLLESKAEVVRLRSELQTNKVSVSRITELEEIIAQLTIELGKEKQEKSAVILQRDTILKDSEMVNIDTLLYVLEFTYNTYWSVLCMSLQYP